MSITHISVVCVSQVEGEFNLRHLAAGSNEALLERTQDLFLLTEQGCLSDESLFYRREAAVHPREKLVSLSDYQPDAAEKASANALLNNAYSPASIFESVRKMFGDRHTVSLEELSVETDKDFVTVLLSLVYSTDPLCFYRLKSTSAGLFNKGVYQLPHAVLTLKEDTQS